MNLLVLLLLFTIPHHPASELSMETEVSSYHQQILDTILLSLDKSLKSAISSITERQDKLEEVSSRNLTLLQNQVSNLLLSISGQQFELEPDHTQNKEILSNLDPQAPNLDIDVSVKSKSPSQVPYLTDQIESISSIPVSPSSISIPSTRGNKNPDIDAASRTLGFYPFKECELDAVDTHENFLISSAVTFMENVLKIPKFTIRKFLFKKAWYSRFSSTIYIEFSAKTMCHTVFKHLPNLSPPFRVFQFILPPHQHQFRILSDQAFHIRSEDRSCKTRVEYKDDSLVLSIKRSEDSSWHAIQSFSNLMPLPPVNSSHSNSPWSTPDVQTIPEPLPQVDCLSVDGDAPSDDPTQLSLDPLPQVDDQNDDDTLSDDPVQLSLDPLPQVDGQYDDDRALSTSSAQQNPTSNATLFTNYSLNQHKQVQGLLRHSKLPDFDIIFNDSDRNATIQCSLGFYEAVVKPVFSTISTGFRDNILGINIECTEARVSRDQNDSIPGFFLRFILHGSGGQPDNVPLTVHLHHTQSKAQLQGGAKMPDGSSAVSWFIERILKDKLIREAKHKKFSIESINNTVKSLIAARDQIPTETTFCSHCKKKFGNSSRPIKCYRCSKYKHKTKCLGSCPSTSSNTSAHPLLSPVVSCPPSPSPSSITSPATVSYQPLSSATQPVQHQLSQQLINFIPASSLGNSTPTSSPTPPEGPLTKRSRPAPDPVSQESDIGPSSPHRSLITCSTGTTSYSASSSTMSATLTHSSLPPPSTSTTTCTSSCLTAPSIARSTQSTPFVFNSQPQTYNQASHHERTRKRKLPSGHDTPEQNEIKYLKIELNSVQAKFLEIETENIELKRKVKIMEDLIKTYESNIVPNIYTSGPPSHTHNAKPTPPNQPCSCPCQQPACEIHCSTCPSSYYSNHSCQLRPRPQKCPSQPSPADRPCSCPGSSASSTTSSSEIKEVVESISQRVDKLQSEMVDVVNNLESISRKLYTPLTTSKPSEKLPEKPAFQNPSDIPGYDKIDTLEVVEVHVEAVNDSITSMDANVPDIPIPNSLNYSALTSQL